MRSIVTSLLSTSVIIIIIITTTLKMLFSRDVIYSFATATPLVGLVAGSADVPAPAVDAADGAASVAVGDGAAATTPPPAKRRVGSVVDALFGQSPTLDDSTYVRSTVMNDYDRRTLFFSMLEVVTGSGETEMGEAIMHICNSYLNDISTLNTTGNIKMNSMEFDASSLSRAVRTVFPAAAVATHNRAAAVLGSYEDVEPVRYTGLWVRLLSIAYSLALGQGAAGAVTAAMINQAVVSADADLVAALDSTETAAAGGVGVVWLPTNASPLQLTDAIVHVLRRVGNVNCGMAVGALRHGLAALVTDEMRVYLYGTSNARFANAAAVVPTGLDVVAAMRWLMAATGDHAGLDAAVGIVCGRIRFYGPGVTVLPTPPATRFYGWSAALAARLDILYHTARFHTDRMTVAAYGPILAGCLGVAVQGIDYRAYDQNVGLDFLGAAGTPLHDIADAMSNYSTVGAYLRSLTTGELTVVSHHVSGWNAVQAAGNIGVVNPMVPGLDLAFGLPVPNGPRTWDHLQVDNSVAADGFLAQTNISCCAGLSVLRSFCMGAAGPKLASATGMRLPMEGNFIGLALLKRIFTGAAIIRAGADLIFDNTNSSAMIDEYASGAPNTGNAELDEILGMEADAPAYISQEILSDAVLAEANNYGILADNAINDAKYTFRTLDDRCFEHACIRKVFVPSIIGMVLGSSTEQYGGGYNISNSTLSEMITCPTELLGNHKITDVRTTEVAALLQSLFATKGRTMDVVVEVRGTSEVLGYTREALVAFMPTTVSRPSDQHMTLNHIEPTLLWYRPAYRGQLRLRASDHQLRAGYNIVGGLRIESDPTVYTSDVDGVYNGNARFITRIVSPRTRTKFTMGANAVAAPPVIAAAAGVMPTARAVVAYTSGVLVSLGKATAIVNRTFANRASVGTRARVAFTCAIKLTIDVLRSRCRSDAHNNVYVTPGMARVMGIEPIHDARTISSDFR